MVDFKVGLQQHEWVFDPQGNRQGRWIVPFTTPSGVQSEVLVADHDYNPQHVATLIAGEVKRIEDVQHLERGEPAPHRGEHHAA